MFSEGRNRSETKDKVFVRLLCNRGVTAADVLNPGLRGDHEVAITLFPSSPVRAFVRDRAPP